MPQLSRIVTESKEATSIKYNTMVYELKERGKNVLIMSLGEAFFDIPRFSMDDLPYPDVNHYSHSRGLSELRKLLSGYFLEQYGVSFDFEREIIVTAGSKAAIHMTLMSVLNPGDEVIFSEPAWVSYAEQIKLCYGVPIGMPYQVTVSQYQQYITDRTRAIIISNPHNPRGYVFTEQELRELLTLAKRHDLWILSDEAYSDFVIDDSFTSLGRLDREKKHAVVFNSMSKNYGVSGWRIGYVIANKDLVDNVLKVNQHLITCPPTLLEYYLARHFQDLLEITKPQIKEVVNKRKRLAQYMDNIGLSYLQGGATFYFFVSIAKSRLSSEAFCTRLLNEQCISIVPGSGYGESCDQFVRVSVGTATLEENQYGLDKIKQLIELTS